MNDLSNLLSAPIAVVDDVCASPPEPTKPKSRWTKKPVVPITPVVVVPIESPVVIAEPVVSKRVKKIKEVVMPSTYADYGVAGNLHNEEALLAELAELRKFKAIVDAKMAKKMATRNARREAKKNGTFVPRAKRTKSALDEEAVRRITREEIGKTGKSEQEEDESESEEE